MLSKIDQRKQFLSVMQICLFLLIFLLLMCTVMPVYSGTRLHSNIALCGVLKVA